MTHINFGSRRIGPSEPPFLIAEIGINHGGAVDICRGLIDNAKDAGADAVKLQTYVTEKRVEAGSPIFDILKACEISFDDQEKLFEHAREIGIEIFSTPFDKESVEFLATVGAPGFKIASFDIINKSLLREVAAQKKPVIASCGMAEGAEIDEAVKILRENNIPFALLHCISAYPVSSHTSLNLKTIALLKRLYDCPVGFSDHTMGIEASVTAVAAGAQIIERHFTYDRAADGPDHAISLEPGEFKEMAERIRWVSEAMGNEFLGVDALENDTLQYRRPSD